MSLGTTESSTVPGERAENYELCPLFTYSISYWEVYIRFQRNFSSRGGGDGVTWQDLSIEEFFMEEEDFYEGGTGFSSIVKKKQSEIKKDKFFRLKVRSSTKI